MFCVELYYRKTRFSSGNSPQWAGTWGEKTAGEQRTAVFLDGEQCVGECEVHFVSGEAAYLRWIYIDSPLQNRGIGDASGA